MSEKAEDLYGNGRYIIVFQCLTASFSKLNISPTTINNSK